MFLRVEMVLNGQMAGISFLRNGLKMRLMNITAHTWTYMDYGTLGNAIHIYHFYVNVLQVSIFPTRFRGVATEAECDLSILYGVWHVEKTLLSLLCPSISEFFCFII